jgi:putative phosphoribosyl transferase
VVLGLARGGVPVASELAGALGVPWDVFLVRKLGVPQWPELAMGAISSGGAVVLNQAVIDDLRITESQLQAVTASERTELHRRERLYRGERVRLGLGARIVIVVDDGVATGASMRVALRALRAMETDAPAQLVAAVPVGPHQVCLALRPDADDVVCALSPARFEAVGQAYADFHQISDDEVRELLETVRPQPN